MFTGPVAIISADMWPLISMLPARTRRKHCTSALAFDADVVGGQAARDFADEIDRGDLFALQIAAKLAFDQGRFADHAGAAEIAFRSEMKFATSPNGSTKTGGNFVIAQIDVRAAARDSWSMWPRR